LKFLLDASAMLPVVMKGGRKLIANAAQTDLVTTDLAVYEACNGLWKLVVLTKSMSSQNAQETISLMNELISKNLIKTINFAMLDLTFSFNLAQTNHITFYDATCITAAQRANSVLVTEDKKLFKIASDYVKTMQFAELEKEFDH